MPECSAIEDNYFVREGLYFDEWDEEAIGIAISNGYYNNVSRVSAKFSDASVYQAALSVFFEGGRLADYCEGITRIKYLTNPERGIITVIYD